MFREIVTEAERTRHEAEAGRRPRTTTAARRRRRCTASRCASGLLLLADDGLHRRGDAVGDLDLDDAGADRLDRLLEADVAAIDVDAARLLDRVDDVLRGDGAEEAAVLARLMGDGQHRAV